MKSNSEIILAYGHSDEYSFLFHKDSTFFNRRIDKIVSTIVSAFTGHYVMNWNRVSIYRHISITHTKKKS